MIAHRNATWTCSDDTCGRGNRHDCNDGDVLAPYAMLFTDKVARAVPFIVSILCDMVDLKGKVTIGSGPMIF